MSQTGVLAGLDGLHNTQLWGAEKDTDMTGLPSPEAVRVHYQRARDICQRSGIIHASLHNSWQYD